MGKVSGKSNIADALTKYQRVDKLHALCVPHGVVPVLPSGPSGEDCRTEGGCKVNEPKMRRDRGGSITSTYWGTHRTGWQVFVVI